MDGISFVLENYHHDEVYGDYFDISGYLWGSLINPKLDVIIHEITGKDELRTLSQGYSWEDFYWHEKLGQYRYKPPK